MNKKEREDLKKFLSAGAIMTLMGIVVCLLIVVFSSVKIEGSMSCNTGDLDLNIQTHTEVDAHPCSYNPDLTCYKQDIILDNLSIQRINGLNCKGTTDIRMPFLAVLIAS